MGIPEILIIVNIALTVVAVIAVIICTGKSSKGSNSDEFGYLKEKLAVLENTVEKLCDSEMQRSTILKSEISSSIQALSVGLSETQRGNAEMTGKLLTSLENRLQGMEQGNMVALSEIRATISRQLLEIKDGNTRQLAEIRQTVDEKLQATLEERMTRSFKMVSEQLEAVYKGLGEMQSLATGVGDLKRVLSNVKTRGILGEIQLSAILTEILAPEQYETEVPTIPDSSERVEFAIKLPGENGNIYLPIDAKFPGDTYSALREAEDSGDRQVAETASKALTARLKQCAKDIRDKYVMPPYTTTFAVMFLPFEGLYAKAVDLGMVEQLQQEYSVTIAGPSTMAALLNSLQMGFKTLAIRKRSNEVWQILGAVRAEFEKFEDALTTCQKHIRQVEGDLEKLVGVRTRAITRKLDLV